MSRVLARAEHVDDLHALASAYARSTPPQRVVVVGNAPVAPDRDRAAAVDAADLVIRVNGFRLDRPDEPAAVGTRTDVVVFNRALRASPWFFADYRDRLYLMVEPGRLHWEVERWPGWWPRDLGHVVISNQEVVLPLSRAMGLDSRRTPVWATTGVIALWLGRTLFPSADLAAVGFSMIDDPDQHWWAHSYGHGSPVGQEHLLRAEAALLAGWIAEGTLTYLT